MKSLVASITAVALMIAIGIAIMASEADNCKEAGWDWHWATEQCLPKK